MGINRSQANALSEGFFDNIGSNDKSELVPRETLPVFFQIAGSIIELAQDNLNQNKSNASGGLSKSIAIDEPVESNGIISVNIWMAFHGQFVNKGVKGVKSGSSTAGYAFKTLFPSSKMLANLKRGQINAKKSITNTNRKKTVSKYEIKNQSVADAQAWGAAVNIKKFGIKATGFMDKAIQTNESKFAELLGDAFKIDIINSI